jgi:23S rRNA pseudouridine2605 synthase
MASAHRNQDDQPPAADETAAAGQRLQKVLATAGLGSRRACEELIVTGRVEVDRSVVTELGTRVDPSRQEIRVDGVTLRRPKLVCYALHKPPGVVCTARDPAGRPRVIDMVPPDPRVFPVGRLDMSSEGLILLTNDGELANGLTHPRHEVEKLYRVLVAGELSDEDLIKLRRGFRLAEGFARPRRIRIKSSGKKATWLEMLLDEGRNREIRRLLARIGHKVLRLVRVAIGSLRLGELPRGAFRALSREEVELLRRDVEQSRRRHHAPNFRDEPMGRRRKRRPQTAAMAAPAGRSGASWPKRNRGNRRPHRRGRPR